MPKKSPQETAKAAPASVPAKRPGVRNLKTIEDLRRLQGRLIRQFAAGEIGREDFKTLMYGTTCLCTTLKHLEPEPKPASWVSELVLVRSELDDAEQKFINEMNSNILPAPDGDQQ